jgi:hypothetical protein
MLLLDEVLFYAIESAQWHPNDTRTFTHAGLASCLVGQWCGKGQHHLCCIALLGHAIAAQFVVALILLHHSC